MPYLKLQKASCCGDGTYTWCIPSCFVPYFTKCALLLFFFLIAHSSCGLLIQVFSICCGSDILSSLKKGGLEQEEDTELWRREAAVRWWLLRLHIGENVACAKSK